MTSFRFVQIRNFIVKCLAKYDCNLEHAGQLADTLICADYRGHYSHGISRLYVYVEDIATKSCAASGKPKILKRKGATAWVDGQNLLGPVVGNYCMQLAVDIAKDVGIGWVVVKNSNHFGTCGWYVQRAINNGMLGMVFTNTSPCVFPTRSAEKCIGSNPICMAAPSEDGDSFFLDMAASTVAYGKVCLEVLYNNKDALDGKDKQKYGKIELEDECGVEKIPETWGTDCNGEVTVDPKSVLSGGGLQPLGGCEETGGYKGTGLCMMVEILCGILGGAAFGRNIRQWRSTEENADLGHCFIAIDPECFAPGFAHRLHQFLTETRNSKRISDDKPVLVAGDRERMHMTMCDEMGGIVYDKIQLQHLVRAFFFASVFVQRIQQNSTNLFC
uniref:Malate/L-lactate dehydrogenase n=1 Tax=Syphacia muris TaxID=451379 RepID=A0A0N5AUT6_9BILA